MECRNLNTLEPEGDGDDDKDDMFFECSSAFDCGCASPIAK
jgi:hypothetical protein